MLLPSLTLNDWAAVWPNYDDLSVTHFQNSELAHPRLGPNSGRCVLPSDLSILASLPCPLDGSAQASHSFPSFTFYLLGRAFFSVFTLKTIRCWCDHQANMICRIRYIFLLSNWVVGVGGARIGSMHICQNLSKIRRAFPLGDIEIKYIRNSNAPLCFVTEDGGKPTCFYSSGKIVPRKKPDSLPAGKAILSYTDRLQVYLVASYSEE